MITVAELAERFKSLAETIRRKESEHALVMGDDPHMPRAALYDRENGDEPLLEVPIDKTLQNGQTLNLSGDIIISRDGSSADDLYTGNSAINNILRSTGGYSSTPTALRISAATTTGMTFESVGNSGIWERQTPEPNPLVFCQWCGRLQELIVGVCSGCGGPPLDEKSFRALPDHVIKHLKRGH